MDICDITNKTNSHTPKMEIHSRQKLCYFGRCVAKAKLFCLKIFVPVIRAGVFICENFHPGYRDLGRKTRDLGSRASPASHMKRPFDSQTIKTEVNARPTQLNSCTYRTKTRNDTKLNELNVCKHV